MIFLYTKTSIETPDMAYIYVNDKIIPYATKYETEHGLNPPYGDINTALESKR